MRPIVMLPTVPWLSDNIYRYIKDFIYMAKCLELANLLVSGCCESDARDHAYLESNQKRMTKHHHEQYGQYT